MPFHVEISLNATHLQTLHVGRMSKNGMSPDSVNTYRTLLLDRRPRIEDSADGVLFTHRYGDGALVCVERALSALPTKRPPRRCS